MNKILKTGLIMQFLQLIIIGFITIVYALLTISWTIKLLIILGSGLFNIFSICLILVGFIIWMFEK